MTGAGVAEWVACGGLLLGVTATAVRSAVGAERRVQLRVLTRMRARRAERVAVAASVDDPAFSPEAIRASVTEMLDAAQAVWAGREEREHRERRDIQLLRGWANSHRRQLGAALRIAGRPKVDIVSVVNREDQTEDRAIVRLHLRVHRDPKASGNEPGDQTIFAQRIVPVEERWTLVRRRDRWLLASVSGDPISDELMTSPLIASPVEDDERVRETALREIAGRQAVPASELRDATDPELPAPQQLRELSTLDDRFSPQLIEAELRHLVEAWEAHTDGSGWPLKHMASVKAIRALIHPGNGAVHRMIRDARLVDWKVIEIDLESGPPHMRVWVQIEAAVFASDHGKWIGSDRRRTKHALVWKLKLASPARPDVIWELTGSEEA